jgi:hypothetical protein
MKEIINLEEARLCRLSEDELLVKAIESAAEQIGTHARVLRDLSRRLGNLEGIVHDIDQDLEDYR